MDEALFSYGTLQQEEVQLATFGRKLNGKPDTLTGFKMVTIEITDEQVIATSGLRYHNIISRSKNIDDIIEGMVFAITAEELKQADEYEVEDYVRISVKLKSGIDAWVYIARSAL